MIREPREATAEVPGRLAAAPSPPPITYFADEFAFLSNFYAADVEFDGYVYPTAEHGFQAAKSTDPFYRERIWNAPTPGAAKRMGNNSVELRPDWDAVKLTVMETVVLSKFMRHPELQEKLVATGDAELIEGNTWGDRFWGVTADGQGANHLGKILMRVRDYVRDLPKPVD